MCSVLFLPLHLNSASFSKMNTALTDIALKLFPYFAALKSSSFLSDLFEALYFNTCSPVVVLLFTSFLSVFVCQI